DGNTHCILFSDEPERLRSGRAAQICPKHSIFEEPMRDDLALAVLAVCCSGIVISFSTFSWWAAVLGDYKVVVAPATTEQSCSPTAPAENNTLAYVPGWLRADVPCDAERLGRQRDGRITTSVLKWASVALFATAWRSGRRPEIQLRRAVVQEVALDFLPGTDLPSTAPAPLDNEGAADRVRRMVAADPSNKELETERQEPPFSDEDLREAWHELQLGHADEARSRFVRAVLADPSDSEALFCMGLLYEALHDLRRTAEWMDMAIEVCPDHVFAWETRSRCMEHLGRLAESLAGYEQLEMLDESATGRREGLLGHQRVYILPVGAWEDGAAGYIQKAAKKMPPRPQWQENFLFPEPLPALRQPALESGIMAWDNVLSKGLLQRLQDCVEDHFQFIFTNRWVYAADDAFEGAASTMWLPSSGDARSVPEVAALTILRHILNQDPAEIAGVEYWARVRSVNLGAGFHYDEAVDADDINSEWVHGNPWRPQWSSVFYLTDEGGPTVVLDQLHDHDGRLAPTLPRKGYLCMPRTNRLVLFRADLHHGSLPLDIWLDSEQTRRVFVFNFWRRHAPEPPHCQRLNLQHHPAMRRHVLTSDEAAALQAVESSRFEDGHDGPSPVRQKVLSRPEELPHSSDFGYLPRPLPMPTMAALTAERLFYEVDWPAAAQRLPPDYGDVACLGSVSCRLLRRAATSRVVPQPWMEALWGGEAELISDSRLAEAALARAAGQVVPHFAAEVATTFNETAPSAPPVPSRAPLPERHVRQEHSFGPEVRGDWQVLDSASAPQKTVATVSMIDCLWEKVTKVSDDVDSLQEQVQGHSTEINAWIPNHEVARRSELEELSKVCASLRSDCATRRQLEDQATELQGAWRTPMASLSERLGALEAAVKEIPTRLSRESDAAKYALDGLEQRLEQRIQTVVSDRIRTAASEAEVLRDAALERLRAALRQQLQEEAERQEQNTSQLKQRFTDRLDDVAAGLRRLEVSLQSETADRLDSAQKELSHLAAEQMRLARAVDENRKLVDACSEDNRRSLESESRRVTEVEARSLSSSSEIQRLGQRLELQSQEFLSRSKEISQHVDEQMQQATQRLQDFGQELKQQACDAASSTKTELLARLKDVQEGEDGQRRSLEERSNALLDRGLQKLAQEVAERMDEGQENQRLASAATEGRLLGQLESYNGRLLAAESWRSAFQEREAAREQRLSSLGEAMRKMEAVCKDVPALESRIDEARAAIKEDRILECRLGSQCHERLPRRDAPLGKDGSTGSCSCLPRAAKPGSQRLTLGSSAQELPVDVAGARDAAPVGSASIPVSIGSRGLLHVMASISELSPAMSCAQLHAKVGGVPLLRQRFFLAPRAPSGPFSLASDTMGRVVQSLLLLAAACNLLADENPAEEGNLSHVLVSNSTAADGLKRKSKYIAAALKNTSKEMMVNSSQDRSARSSSVIRVINKCYKEPIWIAHCCSYNYKQNVKIDGGASHDFPAYAGLRGFRLWPKMRCNSDGNGCYIGQSGGKGQPCGTDGNWRCQQHVDTKFEATFGSRSDYYDMSMVDGYTLPFQLRLQGCSIPGLGRYLDCSDLTLNACPAANKEYYNGKLMGCHARGRPGHGT
ncbi:unnamed protein product, partial [Symbiodinium necroappetens]